MIVADTGVLYAATDRADAHHERCRDWIEANNEVLLIPATVLAEVSFLIDRALGPEAEATFLDDVGTGEDAPYRLIDLTEQDLRRMAEPVRRYSDRRLGATDASIVAVCERLKIDTVASLNHRDFANLRPKHCPALLLVPD